MDHIPEGDLALFAFDPAALPEQRRRAIEEHTASCADCRSRRDFFAVTEEDLTDVDVWEASISSATRESLMTYAARIAEEDREADELLEPYFAAPAKAAWTSLHKQKRFLTGGVVRRLSTHAHGICESEPLDALTFADAAISIAEALPQDAYPANAVYELRGTAWKERANAQMLLGDFAGALDSLTRAERSYKRLTSPSLGLATVALVRAGVYYSQQKLDEAAATAERAEYSFAHLGDDERRISALYLRANIKYEMRDLDGAFALFTQLAEYGESMNSARWVARALNGLGNCALDRRDFGAASMHLHKVRTLFHEVGSGSDQLTAEWGIGRLLLHVGKPAEAARRLRDVAAEFETLGMITDSALVGLDIAEALLALGETRQIVDLAAHMFRVFTAAGMLTGALTAIAFIKEAAAAKSLTKDDLAVVRAFLRRVVREPEMLFVPPPPKNS